MSRSSLDDGSPYARTLMAACALAVFLAGNAVAQTGRQGGERCRVQALNQVAPVGDDGYWEIGAIPRNGGAIRVRLVCQGPMGVRTGQSGFFRVAARGISAVPSIPFTPPPEEPNRVTVVASETVLAGEGATAQLSVTGRFPDGSERPIDGLASGTNYASSAPDVVSVDESGLLTALRSGNVLISAWNEGTTGATLVTAIVGGDTDGDGLPDDYELAVGLDPEDVLDAGADQDQDGLTALAEFDAGSHPLRPDTDGDTIGDAEELAPGADTVITSPVLEDTDGDGLPDDVELAVDSDPTDPQSANFQDAVTAISVSPKALFFTIGFTGTSSPITNSRPKSVKVTAHLIGGRVADFTRHEHTVWTITPDGVIEPTATPGEFEGKAVGAALVKVSHFSRDAEVTATVQQVSPQALSRLDLPCTDAPDVALAGDHALVACGDQTVIVDLSVPASPRLAATPTIAAADIDVVDGTSAAGTSRLGAVVSPSGLFTLLDVTNPVTPLLKGQVSVGEAAVGVSVDGGDVPATLGAGRALVVGMTRAHFVTWTDPASPAVAGSYILPGVGYGGDLASGFAVVAHSTGVTVYDLATPTNPTITTLPFGPGLLARNVVIADGHAFVATDTSGFSVVRSLQVVRLAGPGAPAVVAQAGLGQYLLRDVAYRSGYLLTADWLYTNASPIIDVAAPADPQFVGAVEFMGIGDADGWGVDADDRIVVVTGSEPDALYVGRWNPAPPTPVQPIAPTVSFTSPTTGAQVLGTARAAITINVRAVDDGPIALVRVRVNGAEIAELTALPYRVTYTLPAVTSTLTLTAEALDFDGNLGKSEKLKVIVAPDTSPPLPILKAPAEPVELTAGDTLGVSATATDNVGINVLRIRVGGAVVAETSPGGAPSASVSATVPFPDPGTSGVVAEAVDVNGNTAESALVTVTVRPPPTTTLTGLVSSASGPIAGASVSASGLMATTDAGGRFTLAGLPVVDALFLSIQPPEGLGLAAAVSGPHAPIADGIVDVGTVTLEGLELGPRYGPLESELVMFEASPAPDPDYVDELGSYDTIDLEQSSVALLPGAPGLARPGTAAAEIERPGAGSGALGHLFINGDQYQVLAPGVYEYESLTLDGTIVCHHGDLELRVRGDFEVRAGVVRVGDGGLRIVVGGDLIAPYFGYGGFESSGELAIFAGTERPGVSVIETPVRAGSNNATAYREGSDIRVEVTGDLVSSDGSWQVAAGAGAGSGRGGDARVVVTGDLSLGSVRAGEAGELGEPGALTLRAGGDASLYYLDGDGETDVSVVGRLQVSQLRGGTDTRVSVGGDLTGDEIVSSGRLTVTSGANIDVYSMVVEPSDLHAAGDLSVTAGGDLRVTFLTAGEGYGFSGGALTVRAGGEASLYTVNGGRSSGAGNRAGDVDLQAGRLTFRSGGTLYGPAASDGVAAPGDVIVRALAIDLTGHTMYAPGGTPGQPAARFELEAELVKIAGASIFGDITWGGALATDVLVRASDTLAMSASYLSTGAMECPWSTVSGAIRLEAGRTLAITDSSLVTTGAAASPGTCDDGPTGGIALRSGGTIVLPESQPIEGIAPAPGAPTGALEQDAGVVVAPTAPPTPPIFPGTDAAHLVSKPIDSGAAKTTIDHAYVDVDDLPLGSTVAVTVSSAAHEGGPWSPWAAPDATPARRYVRWRLSTIGLGAVGPWASRVRLGLSPAPCAADADCDDASACTTDRCTAGECSYTDVTCPDSGDPCVTSTCGPDSGCTAGPNTCEDGDPCTIDSCGESGCEHVPDTSGNCCAIAADCDDGDPCTIDRCDGVVCRRDGVHSPLCCGSAADCPASVEGCLLSECRLESCHAVLLGGGDCCVPEPEVAHFATDDEGFTTRGAGPGDSAWRRVEIGAPNAEPGRFEFGSTQPGTYAGGVVASLRSNPYVYPMRTGVVVEFMVYVDLQAGDTLELIRRRDDPQEDLGRTLGRVVWSAEGIQPRTWTLVNFELAAQAANPFALDWVVKTKAGGVRTGAGVAIDEVVVTPTCAPPPDGTEDGEDGGTGGGDDGGST